MGKYNGPKDSRTPEERAEQNRINGAKAAEVNKNKIAYPESDPHPVETDLADMYADIYDPRAKIDPNLKIHAASCFMLTGTVEGTARMTGLDHRLISEWKNRSQWWPEVLQKIKHEKQDELDARFTDLIHTVADKIKDRLDNGEEVVTKDGIVKKQLGGRDLATMLNTLYDKRSMVRGDPTSITKRESPDDVMKGLRKEFAEIAQRVMDTKVVNDK